MHAKMTNQQILARATKEEAILTRLAAEQHNAMWQIISKDRTLSQARQLQEMLDTNEHRNFVASMWQHWRDVEAAKLITPRRKPLLRVLDTTQPGEPPIPACGSVNAATDWCGSVNAPTNYRPLCRALRPPYPRAARSHRVVSRVLAAG